MKKFKIFLEDPKNRLILWILTGIIIFLVGILSPKADTYNVNQFSAQLYDNTNGSLSAVSTSFDSSMGIYYGYVSWSGSNASGGAWGISSPIPLIANHTYSLSASVPISGCGTTALSSYNRIGVGTTLAGAVSSYQGNTYVNENYSRAVNNYMLQFVFTPSINSSYIIFPYASSSSCNGPATHLESIVIDDLGTGGVSETTINNSLNNQTNIINSSIQSTEQNIINNQNENQQQTNELLGNCHTNLFNQNNFDTSVNGFNLSGLIPGKQYKFISKHDFSWFKISTSQYGTSAYQYAGSDIKVLTFTAPANVNNYKLFLGSSIDYSNSSLWFKNNSELMLFSEPFPSDSIEYIPYNQQVCSSKLDDVTNSLNDDNTTGATSEASNFFSGFNTNTFGLTSIITAPLNLIQSLTSSTCTALHLPLPYLDNKYLDLPCMSSIYSQFFGNFFTLYQTITFGIVAYWVCVRIFNQVKDFKNPEHDEIEVLDL